MALGRTIGTMGRAVAMLLPLSLLNFRLKSQQSFGFVRIACFGDNQLLAFALLYLHLIWSVFSNKHSVIESGYDLLFKFCEFIVQLLKSFVPCLVTSYFRPNWSSCLNVEGSCLWRICCLHGLSKTIWSSVATIFLVFSSCTALFCTTKKQKCDFAPVYNVVVNRKLC